LRHGLCATSRMVLTFILTSVISSAYFIWLALRVGTLTNTQNIILMRVSEIQPALTNIETVLEQIRVEVTALVESTRDGELPAEVAATLERLRVLADHIQSIVPDETPIGTSVAQV
jgi:hypothetical protein